MCINRMKKVIHRHYDESPYLKDWREYKNSVIIGISIKTGVPVMTIKYTKEQLNKFDKDLLIELFLGMQGQMEELSRQTQALNDRMQLMMEQMVLFQKNRFGRSSEKMADSEQIRFMEVDGTIVFFNEAEAVCDLDAPEPDDLELKAPKKKKQPGKKAADIAGLTVKRIDHYLKVEFTGQTL